MWLSNPSPQSLTAGAQLVLTRLHIFLDLHPLRSLWGPLAPHPPPPHLSASLLSSAFSTSSQVHVVLAVLDQLHFTLQALEGLRADRLTGLFAHLPRNDLLPLAPQV
ncbi:hypothetical protein Vafri_19398, partial [Volvox africanus]